MWLLSYLSILTVSWAVHRLRVSNAVSSSAPLSEPAQKIAVNNTDDLEKKSDEQIDIIPPHEIVVYQEDEKFEWREVIRGMFALSMTNKLVIIVVSYKIAFKDPQVWMTAISYMGIIISLYSFSLFLYVRKTLFYTSLLTMPFRPSIVTGLGFSGEAAQLHTG